MRTLVIGDIHGSLTALATLVDAAAIKRDDLLVTLGDYVDRGRHTREVLDWLIEWDAIGRLVSLTGNHEIMMLAAREDSDSLAAWLLTGGEQTLQSYAAAGSELSLDVVPDEHWRFLQSQCRPWFETETHIFVHASLQSDLALEDQPEFMLYWQKFHEPPSPHQSGKAMICGHTPQSSGRPLNLGHAICIDTGVYLPEGWLTCLDVVTGRYWQTNKRGQLREDTLDEEAWV